MTLYEKHPAGRDLDALVAEKVMGFRRVTSAHTHLWCLWPPDEPDDADWLTGDSEATGPYRDWNRWVPRYSVDPAATVNVMEAMRAKGWVFKIHFNSDGWTVEVWQPDGPGYGVGYALQLPHAVSLAALLATGAIEEGPC